MDGASFCFSPILSLTCHFPDGRAAVLFPLRTDGLQSPATQEKQSGRR